MGAVYSYVHTVPSVTVTLYTRSRITKYILSPTDFQLKTNRFCLGMAVILDIVVRFVLLV